MRLLHPSSRDQIAYIASEYYDRVVTSSIIRWIGVVKTHDREGVDALFISCEPSRVLQEQDIVLLDNIEPSFKMLETVLRSFFRVQSATFLQQDSRQSAVLMAQGYFGGKPTLLMEGGSIAPVDSSWQASLIWEKEFNQSF